MAGAAAVCPVRQPVWGLVAAMAAISARAAGRARQAERQQQSVDGSRPGAPAAGAAACQGHAAWRARGGHAWPSPRPGTGTSHQRGGGMWAAAPPGARPCCPLVSPAPPAAAPQEAQLALRLAPCGPRSDTAARRSVSELRAPPVLQAAAVARSWRWGGSTGGRRTRLGFSQEQHAAASQQPRPVPLRRLSLCCVPRGSTSQASSAVGPACPRQHAGWQGQRGLRSLVRQQGRRAWPRRS